MAQLDFPVLRSAAEWEKGALPGSLIAAQRAIEWAQHLVVFFPLWMGDMPALLKAFLEQIARPGFAFHDDGNGGFGKKGLGGRSARVVVTMGMPALVYRYYFRAHSVKSLERNVLGFVGIAPVHETLIGMVDKLDCQGQRQVAGQDAHAGRQGRLITPCGGRASPTDKLHGRQQQSAEAVDGDEDHCCSAQVRCGTEGQGQTGHGAERVQADDPPDGRR